MNDSLQLHYSKNTCHREADGNATYRRTLGPILRAAGYELINMEIIITLTDFLILGLLLTFPVLLLIILNRLKTKWTLIAYSIISLFVLGLIIIFFAWWSYKSDLILLKHYGYNIDGMNYTEFYGNVAPDNMEKVKSLETSIMGIGWPIKAYFGYLLFIPYLIIVYIGKILIKRLKKNKNEA